MLNDRETIVCYTNEPQTSTLNYSRHSRKFRELKREQARMTPAMSVWNPVKI